VVAVVARAKDRNGRSSYDGDGLNLASFRESSELEFGADDAFTLAPDRKHDDHVVLKHLKARHTEAKDLVLRFDRPHQSFEPISKGQEWTPEKGKLQTALASLWNQTHAADDDRDEDDDDE
jgi:replicative DNA helicase